MNAVEIRWRALRATMNLPEIPEIRLGEHWEKELRDFKYRDKTRRAYRRRE